MGWWKINPETGMPTEETSKISRPGLACLNAIPGVDDDPDACYTGDAPWDFMEDAAGQLRGLLGESAEFSEEEASRLFLDRAVPGWVEPGKVSGVLRIVDELWADMDDSYEEDWGRKARPPERRVAVKQAVRSLTGARTTEAAGPEPNRCAISWAWSGTSPTYPASAWRSSWSTAGRWSS